MLIFQHAKSCHWLEDKVSKYVSNRYDLCIILKQYTMYLTHTILLYATMCNVELTSYAIVDNANEFDDDMRVS